jgi:hypothetical protein
MIDAEFQDFLEATHIDGVMADTPASSEELERLRALGYTN